MKSCGGSCMGAEKSLKQAADKRRMVVDEVLSFSS